MPYKRLSQFSETFSIPQFLLFGTKREFFNSHSPLHQQSGRECNRLWVLKNSFQGISITKFVRKLLNVRSPQTLEFAEITALVPFSTPTAISPTTQHFRDHLRPRIGVSSAAAAR